MNRVTPTMGPAPTATRHAPVVHDRMRVARSVLCRQGQVSSTSPGCMFIRYDDAAEDVIDPHPINIVNYAGRIGLRQRAHVEKRTHGWVRRTEVMGREMAFRIEAPKGAGRLAGTRCGRRRPRRRGEPSYADRLLRGRPRPDDRGMSEALTR